jgi:hypothetical protein
VKLMIMGDEIWTMGRISNQSSGLQSKSQNHFKNCRKCSRVVDCKDLGHYCFDCQGLLLCQFVGRCQKSSNVGEMIEIFLGTQLVSLPQQHLHAHFAIHPQVSHEEQPSLVPQPYGSPELSPTSVFLFSERMFT